MNLIMNSLARTFPCNDPHTTNMKSYWVRWLVFFTFFLRDLPTYQFDLFNHIKYIVKNRTEPTKKKQKPKCWCLSAWETINFQLSVQRHIEASWSKSLANTDNYNQVYRFWNCMNVSEFKMKAYVCCFNTNRWLFLPLFGVLPFSNFFFATALNKSNESLLERVLRGKNWD